MLMYEIISQKLFLFVKNYILKQLKLTNIIKTYTFRK